jgi:hypothetical protein
MAGLPQVLVKGVTVMVSPWAQEELASVDLGDERLDARAAVLLSTLGNCPNLSVPAACKGHAETQAAYRFFDNDKVSFEKVLAPHVDRTLERMGGQAVVLLVQDTTEIDLTRPQQQVGGVGKLDGGSRRGVLLHVMHAYTPDGTPLGTVSAQCLNRTEEEAREPKKPKKRPKRKQAPIEQKESMRWLDGQRRARQVAAQLPGVQCVCVGDSEADIYELLAEPRSRQAGGPAAHWLIRACQDRALADSHGHLREALLAAPALYQAQLLIRDRQAKTSVEERARRKARQGRQATVTVRAATVTLRAPWRGDRKLEAVTVNVVLVREDHPPAGEEPVEWVLLTTLPIGTPAQVRRVVEYYCVRWNIEILFRTLKAGCRIERRRLEQVERVLPCLMMYLIVAWRTMFVCRMGREFPDADCQTIFEPSEWKAVWAAVHHKKPPKKRPKLSEMVHLIARLGGYVEHPEKEPGPQALWIGLQRMYDLAWAWDAFGPEGKVRDA